MHVDDDVVAFAPQTPPKRHIIGDALKTAPAGHHDDLVYMGIATHDWLGCRLDHVRQMRGGELATERADRGRREDDVADQSQPEDENPGRMVDGRWGIHHTD